MNSHALVTRNDPFTATFATAAWTAVVALSLLGPRSLDADGDDNARGEKARIAAAMPERVRASAKLVRDTKSPSGWSAVLSVENPTDEDAEIHTDLAVYEARGNEMSREGPVARLQHQAPVNLTVKAHAKAEARVVVPKGKLSVAKARGMRQAYATVTVVELVRPDGTVVAAAPDLPSARMGLRRMAARMPSLVDDQVQGRLAAPLDGVGSAGALLVPAVPNQKPADPPPAQAGAPRDIAAAAAQ